ncbi:ubiquitin carboxyl-terminal hydrolase 11 [Anaeramoeba flamelloides]|uniref:Ubiquitin carboxyl-terminal hydrolase 11 n=1 Tax=Anaeramoeba flamelloides TaxID=1746091 RepID=A0ABQ8YVN6_9EUKA|nr:ubiquitin carboxyl-terminal hydrolase 11 [Anaeramoeba flamelloides]
MTNQKLSDEILRQKIQDIVTTEKHLKEGNECYLIPAGWYDRLFRFVHENASRPPQINTRRLFQNRSAKLKKDLVDFSDYVIISKKLWNLLRSQFSSTQEIMRRVIKNYKTNQLFVELFPIEINVVFGNNKKIIQSTKGKDDDDEEEEDTLNKEEDIGDEEGDTADEEEDIGGEEDTGEEGADKEEEEEKAKNYHI